MKRDLVALIDRMRADLAEAAVAIERGDIDGAISKFAQIGTNAAEKAEELRAT